MGGVYLKWFVLTSFICSCIALAGGCSVERLVKGISDEPSAQKKPLTLREEENLYEKFYRIVVETGKMGGNSQGPVALQHLPRDAAGEVNWTTAVMQGMLAPRWSLDAPEDEEDSPLNLNIFIEAKVPLMANVVFPHSIHTYWLSCNNCHPKIFIPERGANPITMDEIFEGKWCGRCHGKVAFNFWPEPNCRRCHMVPKKMSGQKENF
jgi:c(7)-type cytochrome triheme protein